MIQYYEEEGRYYLFTTKKADANKMKSVQFEFNEKKKVYWSLARALPATKGLKKSIDKTEYECIPPTAAQLDKIAKDFDEIEQLESQIEELENLLNKKLEKLEAQIEKHGLKTKPGRSEDALVMLEDKKLRLHVQEAVSVAYNTAVAEQMSRKFPALKKALRQETRWVLDRCMVNNLIDEKKLPPSIINQIVQLWSSKRLARTNIPNYEPAHYCHHCGFKKLRSGCKNKCPAK